MSGFVYLWKNLENNKMYLGSHKGKTTDNYIGSGVYFKRAYEKNPEKFKRKILYVGKDFIEVENQLLKVFDLANNKMFYNLKNDAVGGWEHTHIDKKIIDKRSKAISNAKKGKVYSHLDYDKSGQNNPMYGKRHSEETKEKIRLKRIGKRNFSKKVLDVKDGVVFNSVKECAEKYNITESTMSVLIRNKEIKMGKCKGKIFRYV